MCVCVCVCVCVVTCGCCVLFQLNLTGLEGGREEQQAWPPSLLNNIFWVRKCSCEVCVCVRLPAEVTLYMNTRASAECTAK